MKNTLYRHRYFIFFILAAVLNCSSLAFVSLLDASTITSVSDTLTREKIATASKHTIQFTLGGTNKMSATSDAVIDFSSATSAFTVNATSSGTWLPGDFTLSDSGTVTAPPASEVTTTSNGALTYASTCTNGYKVAVTTTTSGTNPKFGFRRCAAGSSSTLTITLDVDADGLQSGGQLKNPTSISSNPESQRISIGYYTGGTANTDTSIASTLTDSVVFAVSMMNDDQASVSASVDPVLTFAVGVDGTICTATSSITAGASIAFGVLDPTQVNSSGYICTRFTTNAYQGAAVYVKSTNGALVSTRITADKIPNNGNGSGSTASVSPTTNNPSAASSTESYGLCVGSGASDTGKTSGGSPSATSPYNPGTCTSSATTAFGKLMTSYNPVWATTSPSSNAFANILINTTASQTTVSHNDYTDTLTFIAIGTF